jgi:hypothetical protein
MVLVVGMVLSLLKASDGVSFKTASVSQQTSVSQQSVFGFIPEISRNASKFRHGGGRDSGYYRNEVKAVMTDR